jgi:hypothetical protein
LPLFERTRVEIYLPDLPSPEYKNLLRLFEEELTYAFGGASIVRGLEGRYLTRSGELVPDRINLLYSDASLALSTNFSSVEAYVRGTKRCSNERTVRRDNPRFRSAGVPRCLSSYGRTRLRIRVRPWQEWERLHVVGDFGFDEFFQ